MYLDTINIIRMPGDIKINGQDVEVVDQFNYLGSDIFQPRKLFQRNQKMTRDGLFSHGLLYKSVETPWPLKTYKGSTGEKFNFFPQRLMEVNLRELMWMTRRKLKPLKWGAGIDSYV